MTVDIKSILAEYNVEQDEFGFTSVSDEEYNEVINESAQTVEAYKKKLLEVEKLIIPFLTALLKTADNPYIHWPNRAPRIQSQIEKIVKITRS